MTGIFHRGNLTMQQTWLIQQVIKKKNLFTSMIFHCYKQHTILEEKRMAAEVCVHARVCLVT